MASTDGFEQGGVRLVADLDIEGQFVEEQAGQRALHPVMTAADQQEIGGVGGQPVLEIRHHVIHHQTLVIHRMRQLGDEFTDDALASRVPWALRSSCDRDRLLRRVLLLWVRCNKVRLAPSPCARRLALASVSCS